MSHVMSYVMSCMNVMYLEGMYVYVCICINMYVIIYYIYMYVPSHHFAFPLGWVCKKCATLSRSDPFVCLFEDMVGMRGARRGDDDMMEL